MFVGHFALGFAAKPLAPETSLGWLLAAALLPDLLWPIFLLFGWEQVRIAPGATAFTPLEFVRYPISHSLLAVAAWALALGGLYRFLTGDRRGATVVGACVVSHWILDWVSHAPDLPLWPGGPRQGLGLWNWPAGALAVEGLLIVVGIWIYARSSRGRPAGLRLTAFVVFLGLVFLSNTVGPPPPSVAAVIAVGIAGWLFPFWGAWIDGSRSQRTRSI